MDSCLNKIVLSVIVLLVLSGCDSGVLDQSSSVSNQNQTKSATSQAKNLSFKRFQSPNHDQKMVMLAKKIPGLGGLFVNESGQLTIYLTQPAKQKAQARANLSSFKPLTKTLSRLKTVAQTSR